MSIHFGASVSSSRSSICTEFEQCDEHKEAGGGEATLAVLLASPSHESENSIASASPTLHPSSDSVRHSAAISEALTHFLNNRNPIRSLPLPPPISECSEARRFCCCLKTPSAAHCVIPFTAAKSSGVTRMHFQAAAAMFLCLERCRSRGDSVVACGMHRAPVAFRINVDCQPLNRVQKNKYGIVILRMYVVYHATFLYSLSKVSITVQNVFTTRVT